MTISSSLNAGVAGLNVNANRLATISDNIANSGTFGYKRTEADFHSMVTSQAEGSFSAGGVRSTVTRFIDQRGSLTATDNPTDLSIGGRGFMPVTKIAALNGQGSLPVSLVTTGSFRADADGILRTATGEVLMGWPANTDGTFPTFPRDSFNSLEPVTVNTSQFIGDPTTEMSLSVNLPATATDAAAPGPTYSTTADYFDNIGNIQTLSIAYTPDIPAAAVGLTNTWTMSIVDSASGAAPIAEYTLVFDDSRANGGNLISATPIGATPPNPNFPTTGDLPVNVAGGSMLINIGLPNQPGGLTQLADTFSRAPVIKNGSTVGDLTRVETDATGKLFAVYDSGVTRALYQIPVIDVPNVNGLTASDNQTYSLSVSSGPPFLWNAGEGPTGEMIGFAREESTTDVAGELTQLIQTQRAYSSNAKVIQTVDEMLQETTNIKR